MITITATLLGFIRKTWHIAVGIDLPVWDFKETFGIVSVELTTGPKTATPPAQSVPMTRAAVPNDHAPMEPAVAQAVDDSPAFSDDLSEDV